MATTDGLVTTAELRVRTICRQAKAMPRAGATVVSVSTTNPVEIRPNFPDAALPWAAASRVKRVVIVLPGVPFHAGTR